MTDAPGGKNIPAPPCSIVVFGASGDLAKRKLIPALHQLYREKLLVPPFSIVGFARTAQDDAAFRKAMKDAVRDHGRTPPSRDWETFAGSLHYVSGGYDDEKAFEKLKAKLESLETKQKRPPRRLFYLSTPPNVVGDVIERIGAAWLAEGAGGWARVVVEKPFGCDLATAKALNHKVHGVFDESQVYRIDHYLGKESVQNIMILRFGNGIFEPVWNRGFIDHVQITAAETIGVEDRAGYYEGAGALRDMFQNHMVQLLALVAMEPPSSFEAEAVRNERVKVLEAIDPITDAQVSTHATRGQYAGYRKEPGVAPQSSTETFAALRFEIDNWRWAGVPFYLRGGKKLKSRVTEITIQFKRAPHLMFKDAAGPMKPNALTLRIQPDEGISLAIEAKVPGQALETKQVALDFTYAESFGVEPPEAYERLLLDCMLGDATLFNRADSVEKSWELVMPTLERWSAEKKGVPRYAGGSWGPDEARALIERDGRRWADPT